MNWSHDIFFVSKIINLGFRSKNHLACIHWGWRSDQSNMNGLMTISLLHNWSGVQAKKPFCMPIWRLYMNRPHEIFFVPNSRTKPITTIGTWVCSMTPATWDNHCWRHSAWNNFIHDLYRCWPSSRLMMRDWKSPIQRSKKMKKWTCIFGKIFSQYFPMVNRFPKISIYQLIFSQWNVSWSSLNATFAFETLNLV